MCFSSLEVTVSVKNLFAFSLTIKLVISLPNRLRQPLSILHVQVHLQNHLWNFFIRCFLEDILKMLIVLFDDNLVTDFYLVTIVCIKSKWMDNTEFYRRILASHVNLSKLSLWFDKLYRRNSKAVHLYYWHDGTGHRDLLHHMAIYSPKLNQYY